MIGPAKTGLTDWTLARLTSIRLTLARLTLTRLTLRTLTRLPIVRLELTRLTRSLLQLIGKCDVWAISDVVWVLLTNAVERESHHSNLRSCRSARNAAFIDAELQTAPRMNQQNFSNRCRADS